VVDTACNTPEAVSIAVPLQQRSTRRSTILFRALATTMIAGAWGTSLPSGAYESPYRNDLSWQQPSGLQSGGAGFAASDAGSRAIAEPIASRLVALESSPVGGRPAARTIKGAAERPSSSLAQRTKTLASLSRGDRAIGFATLALKPARGRAAEPASQWRGTGALAAAWLPVMEDIDKRVLVPQPPMSSALANPVEGMTSKRLALRAASESRAPGDPQSRPSRAVRRLADARIAVIESAPGPLDATLRKGGGIKGIATSTVGLAEPSVQVRPATGLASGQPSDTGKDPADRAFAVADPRIKPSLLAESGAEEGIGDRAERLAALSKRNGGSFRPDLSRSISAAKSPLALDPANSSTSAELAAGPAVDRLVARINGAAAGSVELIASEGTIKIRLGSILELVSARMPRELYARLSASSAAENFVSLEALNEQGLAISYDPVYDELKLGKGAFPQGEQLKSHIEQIAPLGGGPSRTIIEQIR
jgi:hypothetical protein